MVMAKYKDIGEIEDYIDLIPILRNLYIDPHIMADLILHLILSVTARDFIESHW